MFPFRLPPVRALATWAGIVLVVALVSRLHPRAGLIRPDVVAAALFLYVPLFHYRRGPAPSWSRVGDLHRSVIVLAGLVLAGAAGYFLYSRLPLPPSLAPPRGASMPPAGEILLRQGLLAALPEEVFFRGYLYDAFEERGRKPIVPTSVLFAAGHLAIHASPWRAMTFFPALLFGWARRESGKVYVPVLLHLAFNCFQYLPGA